MGKQILVLGLTLAAALQAGAQVTSEWRTGRDVPVAVIEVVAGDVEHLAAVVPADAAPPAAIAGFPVEVRPRRGAQVWGVTVPSLLAPQAVADLAAQLAASGAAAVVALGAVPARELQDALAALDAVPARPLPRSRCVLADGGVAVQLGNPDRVELVFALPPPDDSRADLIPALVAWVQTRLAGDFPDVKVESELHDDCARMVVRLAAANEHPRAVVRRIRQRIAALASTPVTGDELARALAACQARAVQAAVRGGPVARDLAERLALGGGVAAVLATPVVDADTLAELARQILGGHAGFATVVEQERRPRDEARQTLDNGAVVQLRFIPGEIGVVAVALGNVAPRAAGKVLAAAATAAARKGWVTTVREFAGVPAVAVAAPAAVLTDVIEQVSDGVTSVRPAAHDDLQATVMRSLGLANVPAGEAYSIALALPADLEIGGEAAGKFFGGIPPGQVTAGATTGGVGLNWTVSADNPEVAGVVELPPTAAGMVAAQLLRDRLASEPGITTMVLAPVGRLALTVAAAGDPHVPALDGRLAGVWRKVSALKTSPGEVAAAGREVFAAFYGDAAVATARTAAAAFLPVVPTEADLLGADPAEVGKVIAALPAWEKLVRYARGVAPPATPPRPAKLTVRKSPPPRS
jgi:hypothetical protein